MKRFILKVIGFSSLAIVSLLGVFLLENGTADPFYQRFVTPKQEALILGNSKAAQGIIPSVLNRELKGIYDGKLYNYSFTVYNSPFGPAYLESVKSKLADFEGERCFIITVDPWSISSDRNDPNDEDKFEENTRFIAGIEYVNAEPNIPFMIKWFSKSYYEIPLARVKQNLSKIHKDGWFESTGDLVGTSEIQRRELMVDFYSDYLKKYAFSELRFHFLRNTIEFLKRKGDVYLVRMPLHHDILDVENSVDPHFDERIVLLSTEYRIPFLDFTELDHSGTFKDGLHLTKESAMQFSLLLAQHINQAKSRVE